MKINFKIFKNLISEIISAVYPYRCLSCSEVTDKPGLCDDCEKKLDIIDPKKRCLKCGCAKSECVCNARVFRFENLVSLYRNNGSAQAAYYSYKLGKRICYASYFAQNLCDAVTKEFRGINFEYLTYVPSSLRSMCKRGFDHCGEIAKIMSQKMDIPLVEVLKCRNFRKSQHESDMKARIQNVKNKYYFTDNLKGGNILLFDDIVTTGSTLDECAKQLLIAGADKVYCISVLRQTKNQKTKGEK